MIENIPTLQPQLHVSHYESEMKRKRSKHSFGASFACYGGGKSQSSNKSDSTTTTTTTSNVQDQRQGVSEEGILAEEGSTVQVDRSTTTIVEDVSEEIAIAAIDSNQEVSIESIESSRQLAESAFDTSEELFVQATDFAGDTVSETQTTLRLAAQQQGDLAAKFLQEGKNLIQDQNRDSGERIGNTVVVGVLVLGGGFLALQFFKKGK